LLDASLAPSLFTSQQYADAQAERSTVLKASNVTLAETFAAAGYDTAGLVASPILAALDQVQAIHNRPPGELHFLIR